MSPLLRHDAPETSRDAAESVRGLTATLREKCFRAIQAAGATGLTAEEVEGVTGLGGSTVRPRLIEIQAEGRIVRTSHKRPTRSGRNAFVYVATAGEPVPTGRVCSFCRQPEPLPGGRLGGGEWLNGEHVHNGRGYAAMTPPPVLALEF